MIVESLPVGQSYGQHEMIGQLVLLHHNIRFSSRNKSAKMAISTASNQRYMHDSTKFLPKLKNELHGFSID
jgi:hypothetical protein